MKTAKERKRAQRARDRERGIVELTVRIHASDAEILRRIAARLVIKRGMANNVRANNRTL